MQLMFGNWKTKCPLLATTYQIVKINLQLDYLEFKVQLTNDNMWQKIYPEPIGPLLVFLVSNTMHHYHHPATKTLLPDIQIRARF